MDCPECGQGFSIVVGPVAHGRRVRRRRHCVACRHEWRTVETDVAECAELFRVSIDDLVEKARRDYERIVEVT